MFIMSRTDVFCIKNCMSINMFGQFVQCMKWATICLCSPEDWTMCETVIVLRRICTMCSIGNLNNHRLDQCSWWTLKRITPDWYWLRLIFQYLSWMLNLVSPWWHECNITMFKIHKSGLPSHDWKHFYIKIFY